MSFFLFTLAALYGKIFSVSFLYFSELALYEFKGGTKDGTMGHFFVLRIPPHLYYIRKMKKCNPKIWKI